MKKLRQSKIPTAFAVLALALSAMGTQCDPIQLASNPAAACNPNQVEIAIYDTYLQRLCNCGGTDGEIIARGSSLGCTFALGKTVFVHYVGPSLRHQIVAVGSPGIPDGPVFIPGDSNPIRTHVFTPTATGAYSFRDQYDSGLLGVFTVTP